MLAIPLVLVVVVYVRLLDAQFQWDDAGSITQNLAIKELRSYAAGFLPSLFHSGRPVTETTFAVNYAIGRLDPFSTWSTSPYTSVRWCWSTSSRGRY